MIPFGNIGFAHLGAACPPGTFRTDEGKCIKVGISQDQSSLVTGRDVEILREFEITGGDGGRFIQYKPKEPVSLDGDSGGVPMWAWGIGGALLVGVLLFTFVKD